MSDIAIRVQNLSKCYHIYDNPRDRLKQFVIPKLCRFIPALNRLFPTTHSPLATSQGVPTTHSPQPTPQGVPTFHKEFWALKDVSFEIKRGETVGIIGRNGSGKSTLLQLICGTLNPTDGRIEVNGRIAALLELGSGFNPEFTGRENVYMNAAVLGLNNEEIDERFEDIVAFADIGGFVEQPVKTYSSGMVVRLAFAVAINVHPEILVIDEALAVGDAAFQRKCMRRIEELSQLGVTLLFVSHDTETVKKLCSAAFYLNHGELHHQGGAKDVCTEYERDLFGASSGQGALLQANKIEKVDESPQLDPDLLNSNEKTYGDNRASIDDIKLTNNDYKKINVLNAGMNFVVSYKTIFSQSVSRPVFGIMITNREGVCIFGTNTAGRAVSLCEYVDGNEIITSFHLTNNLGPGVYYLTCGVHTDDHAGGLIYLQRRMDTLILKSLGCDNEVIGGSANLYPIIEYFVTERKL